MSALSIDQGTFSARPAPDATGIHLVLVGECDLEALEPLEKLLDGVHDSAVASNAKAVTIELAKVEFMNSSCLTKVIHWIAKMKALPEESRYRIRFKANMRVPWQKRSLEALRCLATDWITIEV